MSKDDLTPDELLSRYKYAADQTLIAALGAVREAEAAWLEEHPTGLNEDGLTAVFIATEGKLFQILVPPGEKEEATRQANEEMFKDFISGDYKATKQ